MEKVDEAREDFEKAVSLNPNFPIAYIQKLYGDYRYAMQNQDTELLLENLEKFRAAIKKFPDCTECCLLFGQVLAERQFYEEAEKLYKQAQSVNPMNPTILVHRGLLLLQWRNDIAGAVKLMREAIEIDNKCEFAFETLGTIEVQRYYEILIG